MLPGDSIIHPHLEWAELRFVDAGSSLLSLCSTDFDPLDYIGDYDEFLGVLKARKEQEAAGAAGSDQAGASSGAASSVDQA